MKYDLVISRWGLGYLVDDDVEPFLKRCHSKLSLDRPEGKPGIMIFFEPINEDGERTKKEGQ